ncbi:MAG: hypothetical protein V2B19_06130 [Pseudomonadota bacterium]
MIRIFRITELNWLVIVPTRYFTDSGIIGTKAFVAENYLRFKHLFQSKPEKKPKPVTGIDGMYSLKRLSETI